MQNRIHYEKNKAAILKSQQEYRLRNNERIKERKRLDYHAHKDEKRPIRHEYYEANKKHIKQKAIRRYHTQTAKVQEEHRQYYLKNLGRYRTSRIGAKINGKVQIIKGVIKRPYPSDGACELCGKTRNSQGRPLKLGYHHWSKDDDVVPGRILNGLWVCRATNCHAIIEDPEMTKQILRKFETLKSIIDQRQGMNKPKSAHT